MGNNFILKIEIENIKPEIYRIISVRKDMNFFDLHNIIQLAFDWDNTHLYEFEVTDNIKIVPEFSYIPNEMPLFSDNKNQLDKAIKLETVLETKNKIKYKYDFGDNWIVNIEVIGEKNEDANYPICIKGERAAPLEDCGGIGGYYSILEALNNPEDADEELLEWAEDYDPEKFDIEKLNKELKKMFNTETNENDEDENYNNNDFFGQEDVVKKLINILEDAYNDGGANGISEALEIIVKKMYEGEEIPAKELDNIKDVLLSQTPFWYITSEFSENNNNKKIIKNILKRKLIKSITIDNGLNLLSIEERNMIKERYKVPINLSVVKLKNVILKNYPETIELLFSYSYIRNIYEEYKKNGFYFLENIEEFNITNFLQDCGMGYISEKEGIICFTFYEEVKKYIEKQKNFFEKMNKLDYKRLFINELVFLYGVIEKEKFLKIINRRKYKDLIDDTILEKDLEFFEKINKKFPELSGFEILKKDGIDYIVHNSAYEIFENIIDFRKQYIKNDYKIFSTKYLKELIDTGFYSNATVETLKEILRLGTFVTDTLRDKTLLNDTIREIFVLINYNHSNREIMAFLIANGFKINILKIDTILNRFRDIVPKWDYKGYSK
ncbi:pRiA4b ORF-3-like protein [Marinitoga hydrogenitolerans DSM 16785]|uniref:PRiA4b ORF-3-like protein n=1 Tax=Marinitoga hydrogenitolerans (strain DSM 16785 / JCM 12826 / AT1271) TaxID=1122195 RepID=A0A1M5A331_MARH1|nr:plasmid pRiA4b ORF-3 family protein [Marinitoga hydrogenitolerans]SHF24346.1 pRiA4b ORF-3-like protein [Marinitoga hydrogenitolerans DSM 16785]